MGAGGNRIGNKVGKPNNTNIAIMINEVLEKYEYTNHDPEYVKENYVQIVNEIIVGYFDFDERRLKSNYSNKMYVKKIEEYLKDVSSYYGIPDAKGRYHKLKSDNVLLREYVFYLPVEEGERFRKSPELFKNWCDDNLEWFKKEFPTFDIVVSCGHYKTEKTPHMQILFIPLDENGKLANNRFFYDETKEGKRSANGRIRQSDREQSYIHDVLIKYGVSGGVKGSDESHKDLNEYCSELMHKKEEFEKSIMEMSSLTNETKDKMIYELIQENNLLKECIHRLEDWILGVINYIPHTMKTELEKVISAFEDKKNYKTR